MIDEVAQRVLNETAEFFGVATLGYKPRISDASGNRTGNEILRAAFTAHHAAMLGVTAPARAVIADASPSASFGSAQDKPLRASPSASLRASSPDFPGYKVVDRIAEIKTEMAAGITYRYNNRERRHESDVSSHLDDTDIEDRFLALIRRVDDTTDCDLGRGFRAVIEAAIKALAIDDIELAEIEAAEAADLDVPIGEDRPRGPGEPGYEFRRR